MSPPPSFLRFGTLLSCPAWQRLGFVLLLMILLAMMTWWASV